MNATERTAWYADVSGFSKAEVARFRRAPVSRWTTTAERKIGGSIRMLERLADDPELTWKDWRKVASSVLATIACWVSGQFNAVKEFVSALADTVQQVWAFLKDVLTTLKPYLPLMMMLLDAKNRSSD